MNKHQVGLLGEEMVKCDLIKRGITVYEPINDKAGHDLLAFTDDHFYRIQIKASEHKSLNSNGSQGLSYRISTKMIHWSPNFVEGKRKVNVLFYDRCQTDIMAFVLIDDNIVCYSNVEWVKEKRSVHISIDKESTKTSYTKLVDFPPKEKQLNHPHQQFSYSI